jgi:hypothetical protein
MGQGFDLDYKPNNKAAAIYKQRYQKYLEIGRSLEGKTQPMTSSTLTTVPD